MVLSQFINFIIQQFKKYINCSQRPPPWCNLEKPLSPSLMKHEAKKVKARTREPGEPKSDHFGTTKMYNIKRTFLPLMVEKKIF